MDISLYYTEQGEGPPLVMLHGNGENGGYFKEQTAYFKEHYRTIAVDTRGHGRSPRGTAPFTLEQFADDLKDFLEEHHLSDIILLGFSDGGNIALLFALRYPQYLSRLILNGADLFPGGVKKSTQIPICIGYGIASLISLFQKSARSKKEILGLMVKAPHIDPARLKEIRVPTLVIVGTKDMIKQSHTELIANSIPGSHLCIMEGDHFIAAKNSQEFNRQVELFLNETR